MQRACPGDDTLGLPIAEWRPVRSAMQHGDSPVIPQTGLVMAQLQRVRVRFQPRQAGAHIGIQHGGIGEALSTVAQVNCLVIEHMRNKVFGVKGMRRSALAQPQA